MRRAGTIWALALGLVLAFDARAQEQAQAVSLASGFTPDPLRLDGTTAGATPLSGRAPGCRGYVGARPDHVLELTSDFGFLRFFVTAPEHVRLALRAPDGEWRCSGEPLLGVPREEGPFAAGRYEVWIGSALDTQVPYELSVTEFRSVTPATGRTVDDTVAGGADIGLDADAESGRFRDRRFRRGFLPDPRIDEGEAGGAIDAAPIGGGCRGYVEAQPNHVLTVRQEFDFLRVQVEAEDEPVTLIIRTPTGGFLCSAPEEGPAVVSRDAWPEGDYRIWVGSRERGATPSYRVLYSETRVAAD